LIYYTVARLWRSQISPLQIDRKLDWFCWNIISRYYWVDSLSNLYWKMKGLLKDNIERNRVDTYCWYWDCYVIVTRDKWYDTGWRSRQIVTYNRHEFRWTILMILTQFDNCSSGNCTVEITSNNYESTGSSKIEKIIELYTTVVLVMETYEWNWNDKRTW
jgi:hypothetical protein